MDSRVKTYVVGAMFAAAMLAGCKKSAPVSFETWFTPPPVASISEDDGSAYGSYVKAAKSAIESDEIGIGKVSFTPGQRGESMTKCRTALQELMRGTSREGEVQFVPQYPDQLNPYHAAWRHLARVALWEIEDALQAGGSERFLSTVAMLCEFSSDLLSGSATEADLGLSIQDDLRKLLVTASDQFPPEVLNRIADEVEANMASSEALTITAKNEEQNYLAAVQFTQDSFQKRSYDKLSELLGKEVREAVEYLKQMESADGSTQAAYFKGMAGEIKGEISQFEAAIKLPVKEREKWTIPDGSRPWKRFVKHYYRTLRPLLAKYTNTLTRTRLFILDCRIRAMVRSSGVAPADLATFAPALVTDPYTGSTFGYESEGPVFKIYSLGADFRDSGGKTDPEYSEPDIVIERPL
ncbi:MAG: hypothetical protein J0L72_05580 [Armatimonadetes bacterium]|nr:hypothetical protein [Armatimonadota bacterium]